MKTFIITLILSVCMLNGLDVLYGEDEIKHGGTETAEVWYPGQFLIVKPAQRLRQRFQKMRGNIKNRRKD